MEAKISYYGLKVKNSENIGKTAWEIFNKETKKSLPKVHQIVLKVR